LIQGSSTSLIFVGSGCPKGCAAQDLARGEVQPLDDGGCGDDEVEVELAVQPLLDDLEMQKTEEAAAKARPSAPLLSGSYSKLASLSRSLPGCLSGPRSRRIDGNMPQKTTGCDGRKPGSASAAGRFSSVIVCPPRLPRCP
jgi:hypothetical protein